MQHFTLELNSRTENLKKLEIETVSKQTEKLKSRLSFLYFLSVAVSFIVLILK